MTADERSAELARRRDEVASRVARLARELERVRRARSENSDDDEHDPEGATMSQLWSHSTGLLAAAERELDELDASLRRIANGEYGLCDRCGRAIDPARLEALPAAALCIECARLAG